MKESQNRRGVIVGLFVLVATIFFVAGILLVGDLRGTFTSKMELVSLFDDVSGLQKGNNIWLSGVKIGTVSNLEFYGESQVKVTVNINVDARQFIHKDSKIKLSSDGFIGNKILVIMGGTAESEMVKDGDTLSVEQSLNTEEVLNTLQENNKNLLAITTDFKAISKMIVDGEGSLGKLLTTDDLYNGINATMATLQRASKDAQKMIASLNEYSSGLNKEGTLANELTSDTIVFKSLKASVLQLQNIADSTSVFISNLKQASRDPNSPVGLLLNDDASGASLKETIKNLESSSVKLDEDLEAMQHNFLLRRYFKKKAKAEAQVKE